MGDFDQGIEYCNRGEFAAALPLLTRVYNQQPGAFWPTFWLGHVLARVGDTDAAVALLRNLKPDPDTVEIRRIGLIEALLIAGNAVAATAEFEQLPAIMPAEHSAQLPRLAWWIGRLTLEQSSGLPDAFALSATIRRHCTLTALASKDNASG